MPDIELKRSINLPLLSCYGIGTILGAGIYVLIGQVAGYAGVYAPLAFLVAAIPAGFTAFSYAELAVRFPKSAGEAVYIQESFRDWQIESCSELLKFLNLFRIIHEI